MRRVPLMLLGVLGCSGGDDPGTQGVLETNATSYVATSISAGTFEHSLTVVVKMRNAGRELLRMMRCLPTTNHPHYWVEKSSDGDAAWNPNLLCATQGPTLADLRPGEERTDTLQLRAPWLRSFNGQPIGDIEGEFYLIYETQICRSVSTTGVCSPINTFQFVRSNRFRVTK